jgi:glutamate/tyrosine decarboxylase-like PLP-dependent enzyme
MALCSAGPQRPLHAQKGDAAPLSTVCFRAHPKDIDDDLLNRFNEELLQSINRTGEAFLSHTKLSDHYVLRLVVSHLRTDETHVDRVWKIAQEKAQTLSPYFSANK